MVPCSHNLQRGSRPAEAKVVRANEFLISPFPQNRLVIEGPKKKRRRANAAASVELIQNSDRTLRLVDHYPAFAVARGIHNTGNVVRGAPHIPPNDRRDHRPPARRQDSTRCTNALIDELYVAIRQYELSAVGDARWPGRANHS